MLVSLVRAGVPMAVSLLKALQRLGEDVVHYGISIIRDRGLDFKALEIIEKQHGTEGICFVDGWTGKGAISNELKQSLKDRPGYSGELRLVVLADPGGCAWLSATGEDWLIPFGIMGAPISGLVSRSVWRPEGLHGCVIYNDLEAYDCSREFIQIIESYIDQLDLPSTDKAQWSQEDSKPLAENCAEVVSAMAEQYHIDNINRIKPGIAEATRAVMRRVPEHVLIRDVNDPDVALLLYLAEKVGANVTEVGDKLKHYPCTHHY